MTPDGELLRRYAESRSEEAFAELVRRHLALVYSAALRQAKGDPHFAQDVAQAVFTDLARKAAALTRRPVLAGWLYTSAYFAAAKAVRSDRRRRAREQEAQTMRELLQDSAPDCDWDKLRPVLDEAMHELKDADREAVLLRYFENRPFAEVGARLGLSENAARMRVDRALEKLRASLGRRGLTTSVALTTVLSANAIQAVPAGLAATIASASVAGAAVGTGTTLTLLKFTAMTKIQTALVGAIVVAGMATPWVILNRNRANSLKVENKSLRQQVGQLAALSAENERLSNLVAQTRRAPRLPAPPVAPAAPTAETATVPSSPSTNLIGRLLQSGKSLKLTAGQLEPYLQENRRSASSLLAGYRTTGDPALLEEAMQRYPGNPQVAFEAAFKTNASPQEQRHWLDALQQSAPQNSLPDYLSAAHHFRAGQPDQAVQDLIAASGKPQFQDYTLERVQDDEEAYRAAGYSVAEAKAIPATQLLLPQLAQMKELSQNLAGLAKSYRQAGDENSAQATLQIAAGLGQRYSILSQGEPEISQLVGIVMERIALSGMDPSTPYGATGGTVKDRLDQLSQQSAAINQLAQQTEALQPLMTDQDWISYKDRWRNFGEEAAGRWLIEKYGKK